MIPEPVSTLSTACGLLGFFLGNIEKTVIFANDAWKHKDRLRSMNSSLQTALFQIELWCKTWYNDRTREDHVLFWGETGCEWVEIQLHQIIRNEVKSLCRYLYGDVEDFVFNRSDRRRILDQAVKDKKLPTNAMHVAFIRRITYALYKKTLVEKTIQRLREQISDLKTNSTDRISERHEISGSDLEHRMATQARIRTLAVALSHAYQLRPCPEGQWALLLQPPDDLSSLNLQQDELEISFLFSSPTEGREKAHCLTMFYEPDRGSGNYFHSQLSKAYERLRTLDEVDLGAVVNNMLEEAISSGANVGEYHISTRGERTSIAMSVATWTALLWRTSWAESLCTCRVRTVKLSDGNQSPAIYQLTALGVRHQSVHEVVGRQYLLLGLFLAEIALLAPINVKEVDQDFEFELQTSAAPDATIETLDRRSLLRRISEKTTEDYRKAAAHCFLQDLALRADETRLYDLTARNFNLYIERLLKPLQAHYKLVVQHVADLAKL